MATLTIENVPPQLLKRLEAAARRHGQSTSAEVLAQLEKSFGTHKRTSNPQVDMTESENLVMLQRRGRFLEIDGYVESTSGDPVADARAERTEQLAGA